VAAPPPGWAGIWPVCVKCSERQGRAPPDSDFVQLKEKPDWGGRFMVYGLWVIVYGLLFRVQGSGFRVQGSGFRVQGLGLRVKSSGYRVQGTGSRVQD